MDDLTQKKVFAIAKTTNADPSDTPYGIPCLNIYLNRTSQSNSR